MTRKDYIAIAYAIKKLGSGTLYIGGKEATAHESTIYKCALADAACVLADVMQRDNENFDRDRFLMACN